MQNRTAACQASASPTIRFGQRPTPRMERPTSPGTRALHTAKIAPLPTAPMTAATTRRNCVRLVAKAVVTPDFGAAPITKIDADAQVTAEPGVYAVYDASDALQYVGISRKVVVSINTHLESLGPEMVAAVKVGEMVGAGKEELTDAWRTWIESAVEVVGDIPSGNKPGATDWTQRKRRVAKQEIKLTPGKGLDDLTCSIEDLIDQVVKTNKCVAFVKGTRYEPACGFSYKVLSMLTEVNGTDFEVVNVLDEVYNPGLREAIKAYSQWPTIPQVYIDGEFVGGADIVEEMHGSGELAGLLSKK